jgi:hypothetical protein
MNVFITGISGLIGRQLVHSLLAQGHVICGLTRNAAKASKKLPSAVSLVESLQHAEEFLPDVVINLAGAPIADRRWSRRRKNELRESRVDLTLKLVDWMSSLQQQPEVLISGSAVGYYGRQGVGRIDETCSPHDEFQHQLCRDWEHAAIKAEAFSRVCVLRTGLVIAREGGFLNKMLLPFKLGLGGRLGNGHQFMSWIHINDMIAAIEFLINHQTLSGAFNLTAPHAVSNRQFTETLARCLHRPARLHVPEWVLKLALGEMSDLLLTGQNVMPRKLLDAGFQFQFIDLKEALDDVLKK